MVPAKTLLISQILVSCNQRIKAFCRDFAQQFAVSKLVPAELKRGRHRVFFETMTQRSRRTLIKEDAHSCHFQRPSCVFQNYSRLLSCNARKPSNEVRDLRTVFEILEQGGYRNTRATKQPGPAYAFRISFNDRT